MASPDDAFQDNSLAAAPPRLSLLSILFIATFAFLLASFPARQSDLWRRLAAGRQLVHGSTSLAASAAAAEGPSWLFDVVSYAVFAALGGAGLVFVKALLVAGLAVILLRLSYLRLGSPRLGRQGTGWWLPVFCTALAVLAMGMRLPVAPATVSVFMLTLVLWVLWKRDDLHS